MKRKCPAIILTALIIMMIFTSCGGKTVKQSYSIKKDEKFNAVFVKVSIDEFIASGFHFGDSCDVEFSNGFSLKDIPFYSGYYVHTGAPVIVGYPGYEYIAVTRQNQGLWDEFRLSENDTAVVTLRREGKYKNIQDTLSLTYTNNKADYRDDIQFSNFRALSTGNLKENFLYRGASPVDNQKNRAATVDALLEKNKIQFILDLADSEEEYLGYQKEADFSSNYSTALYIKGNTALLDMGSDYRADIYKQKLAGGLRKMISAQGPVYIHCLEGKDRTGFVCFLLESLAGACYDEMLSDYMKTYENYYGFTKTDDSERFNAVASLYFYDFTSYLQGTQDSDTLKNADYSSCAVKYLIEAGMTEKEIAALRNMITKKS